MQCLALTFGTARQASSFYRIHQFREPLREHGVHLDVQPASDFSDWRSLDHYDAIIIQKKLFSVGQIRRFRKLARVLVYDIDDAIWHPHGRQHSWWTRVRTRLRLRVTLRSARLTLAANEVIAGALCPFASRVEVFPMALDERKWTARDRSNCNPVIIGWAGHPVNLRYLEAIESPLSRVLEKHPEARLTVLSGSPPRFRNLAFDFVPFDSETEPETIRSFDIGLLPLDDSAFAAAKSPIKGLQYMASGIPTILPQRGAPAAMFEAGVTACFANTETEWAAALDFLLENPARRTTIGLAARRTFEAQHALSPNAATLAKLLKSVVAA